MIHFLRHQAEQIWRTPSVFGILLALSGNALGQASDHSAIFNVRNYGAKGDAATDDSVTIASAAAAAAATAANGRPASLYFPSGVYRLVAALPTFTAPVSVSGDGHAQSVILVDTAFSGDVFSWSNTSDEHAEHEHAESVFQPAGGARVEIEGIRIVGNRTTANLQNAFVFYDRADHVLMQNVEVFYMTGRALYSGVSQRTSQSYMTRSTFYSLRFFNCGSAGIATVDFNARGGGAGTSEVSVNALDIFAPYGPGIVIHSNGPPVHAIRFSKLRIEGLQNGTITSDLLQIGDASLSGNVRDIEFEQTELIDPYFGFAAIRFAATGMSSAPDEVRFEGFIGGGLPNGKGVVIDAGRNLVLTLRGIHTTDVNVVVASSATVGGPIVLNGFGQESSWTRSIDASSIANVKIPVLQPF